MYQGATPLLRLYKVSSRPVTPRGI